MSWKRLYKKVLRIFKRRHKIIIDFGKKKMLPLTKNELKSYEDAKESYIYGKFFLKKLVEDHRKVRDHCHYRGKYRGAAHSVCNVKFNVPNEIPVIFHRGSNYDYQFIVKELANEFDGQFECLCENEEKPNTFSVHIKQEVIKISKDCNESNESISHKIKFINSSRFMASLLSSLVGNLTEGIHKIKCRGFGCCLEYESVNNNLIKQKGLSCNLNYSKKLNDKLKKKFQSTFKFSNNDINKFILLLRKDLYRYEYMDDWEKFNETTIPEKEFLNIEDITHADYAHAKRVCKHFEI